MRAIRRFTVRPVLPAPLATLSTLALNLRWSWHPETQDVFALIDPELWEAVGHDPVRLLGEVNPQRMASLAVDRRFLRRLAEAADDLNDYLSSDRWFQSLPEPKPAAIAYFSPEYGITGVLPQYSGGLGILAGDHLKTASDLGIPIVAVGLFYRSGYFKQSLTREGWQQERYPVLDPDGLPLSLLREADGTPAKIVVGQPGGRTLHASIWVAHVGRVPLLMLDSDVEDNEPTEREVTDRLYGGGGDHRLRQEMLLGIGGVRALRVWSRITGAPEPEVFHTNEGHAGFLGVERIRELVALGLSFSEALEAARAGTVFTTHTPVPAGIDRFPRDLMSQFFGGDNADPNIPVERVLALGAETYEGGDPAVFNMAVMGLRLAQRANGVAKLHGVVSRGMFSGLWPGFDTEDVPITSITNGVHAPTWVAREIRDLAIRETGTTLVEDGRDWPATLAIPEGELWETKRVLRERLVHDARSRLRTSWMQRGASDAELGWIPGVLDPDILTVGFARRVPSYKRLTLMLRDPVRLRALLLHPTRPVQIVVAGKSHPADDGGKRLIQQLVEFADGADVRHRIVFLPDYDISMALILYPGCDVWLNNPLRPLEACGTSGMKAALNGALNVSILDGWWDEMYDGENGWAIPTADGVDDPDRRDDLEAAAFYDLMEKQVAPTFYDNNAEGLPTRWIAKVRHTLATLGPKVIATRMLQDYVNQLYIPAAASGRDLDGSGTDHPGAKILAAWKTKVRAAWPGVRVDHVETAGMGDSPELGTQLAVRAFLSLAGLTPTDVTVQVMHGRVDESDSLRSPSATELSAAEELEGGRWRFEGQLPLDRTGSFGYTVRILPANKYLASGAELGLLALPAASAGMLEGTLR